jgi:hypothetical protein
MPYEARYTPKDVLDVLDYEKPTNISYISKKICCSRDVVKLNLAQLERDGKARRVDTLGVKESLWVRYE